MSGKMTRRDALKLGSNAAVSAAVTPLLSAEVSHPIVALGLSEAAPSSSATAAGSPSELCFMRAVNLLELMRTKKLSAREVMQAHLKQILRVNSKVNAIVTLVPEDQLMAQAAAADESLAKGRPLGPLHGLPVGVKDLHETNGLRTTFGSPLHRDFIPDFDCRVVQRERNAGAIVIGKTNVPEFGLGSQTFNPVFGPTRNPYDLTKTCGGSTGGGAVALACGMVPLADGSDMGGSLRNPPNFCNIVGIRPSPGRVPNVPSQLGWFTLSVPGPVARNVTDCAFFLSVLAGYDHHSPISIEQDGGQFAQALGARSFKGVRVAMFHDLGLPWEPEVKTAVQAQRRVLSHSDASSWTRSPIFAMPMNVFSRGAIGPQSSRSAICSPRMAISSTNIFIGMWKKAASSLARIFRVSRRNEQLCTSVCAPSKGNTTFSFFR